MDQVHSSRQVFQVQAGLLVRQPKTRQHRGFVLGAMQNKLVTAKGFTSRTLQSSRLCLLSSILLPKWIEQQWMQLMFRSRARFLLVLYSWCDLGDSVGILQPPGVVIHKPNQQQMSELSVVPQ